MVAQWFPKLGVYEIPGQRYVSPEASQGQWSTHQFHANSEFYADFGTYEVKMTVPSHYIVGASGYQVDSVSQGERKTLTYRADDVHDFAWTASSEFVEFEDQWEHVQLRLLIQPEHRAQASRHFKAAKEALHYFNEWVGPYPYSTLTLVDGVGGSNGMEYPTLITCGTTYMLPGWLRSLELVTIHEFGHQYFYGILANNEAEEAWLDEGINSYIEMRIMDTVYGEGSVVDLPWLKVSDSDFQRLNYVANNPERGAIYTKSWEYYPSSDYGKSTYSKPAAVLATLEGYLGWDTMEAILKTYYSEWRFRHPTTRDFLQVIEEVSGEDLQWFFDQYIYGTAIVDYAVGEFGISGSESRVTVQRLGNGSFPVEVLVTFADGSEELVTWNGEDQEKTFIFEKAGFNKRSAYRSRRHLMA